MHAEPVILGETPVDDYPEITIVEDEPKVYTQREFDKAIASVRRKLEKKFRDRVREFEGDDGEAMTAEQWRDRLDAEISLGEYERLVRNQIRKPLRDWLAADSRLRTR